MGGAVSGSVFDHKYQKERSELRRALILSFIEDPHNKNVLSRISAVRSMITKDPEINATARREGEKEFDYSPTSEEAANKELDRLFTIYETATILKSVQCRIGPCACPLGHYAPYFGDPSVHPFQAGLIDKRKARPIVCNICDKVCQSGNNCSYCEYNLCTPCSVIYCDRGHACKLWTHPESQHRCVVCKKFPITAGYRCVVCEDYDICDYCTYKPGRRIVQAVIEARMADYLKYMFDHQEESLTAKTTYHQHLKKMQTNAYPTTLDLYNFSESLHDIKNVCMHEVWLTRTTKEVLRLRSLLSYGKEHSVTAMRESLREGHYTNEEIARLRILVEWSERERSVLVRSQHIVACPIGHACHHFVGRPNQYLRRDMMLASTESERKRGKKNQALCQICDRVVAPEGYHCEFCEYDLCTTCSVIYCSEGHAMKMWTEPEALDVHCSLCNRAKLTAGYHCTLCNVDICDQCTSKEGRGDIRVIWEKEMNDIMAYMRTNKRLSGVAHFYHWRHSNYIVSIGLLAEYVRELRTARKTAENQVIQKPVIDKIKLMRAEIARDVAYSATALRETAKTEHYIFKTQKKAVNEATRLANILQTGYTLQSIEKRAMAGIACPLGHAMSPLDSETHLQPYPPLPVPTVNIRPTKSRKVPETPLSDPAPSVSSSKQQPPPPHLIHTNNASLPVGGDVGSPGTTRVMKSLDAALSQAQKEGQGEGEGERQVIDLEGSLRAATIANAAEEGEAPPAARVLGPIDLSLLSPDEQRRLDETDISVPASLTAGKVLVGGGEVRLGGALEGNGSVAGSVAGDSYLTENSVDSMKLTGNSVSSPGGRQAATQPPSDSSTVDPDLSLVISDVYSEDEETRYLRMKAPPRMCRICGTDALRQGHFCPLCEYDLCCDCSVIYCRLGHPCKIWTHPEASTLSCDMCKRQPIHSGYRCLVCDVDICDICTAKDARNAFMLWPRRELKRIMQLLQDLRGDSNIAAAYLQEQEEEAQGPLNSMSVLCKKLKEVEAIKMHVDEEVRLRKLKLDAKMYGLRGPDM